MGLAVWYTFADDVLAKEIVSTWITVPSTVPSSTLTTPFIYLSIKYAINNKKRATKSYQ